MWLLFLKLLFVNQFTNLQSYKLWEIFHVKTILEIYMYYIIKQFQI